MGCGSSSTPAAEVPKKAPPKNDSNTGAPANGDAQPVVPPKQPAAAAETEAPPKKAPPPPLQMGKEELASEDLLPTDEAFMAQDEGTAKDGPSEPPFTEAKAQAEAPPLSCGVHKRRFRKRSVNITTLPDDQQMAVDEIFNDLDPDKTGFISREAVASVLKDNYRPSALEVEEVMSWMDTKGNERVTFDEYTVAMASVMLKNGLSDSDDIEIARAALSKEVQKRVRLAAPGTQSLDQEPASPINVEEAASPLSSPVHCMEASEENLANAKIVIGETNLAQMQERFSSLDTEQQNYLDKAGIRELVRLTYTAPKENIDAFMRFFDTSTKEEGISHMEFTHGLTLLYGDFSFVVKANNRMVAGVARSRASMKEDDAQAAIDAAAAHEKSGA